MTIKMPSAIFTNSGADHLSDRYSHINTNNVIEMMLQDGFYVHSAKAVEARSRDPQFGKHVVEFRHNDAKPVNGVLPRVLFLNSHDGSTAARMFAGLFRFICSNGLVIGAALDMVKLRHTGEAAFELTQRASSIAKNGSRYFEQVERWSQKQLSAPQRNEFAMLASQLRWGDPHRFAAKEVLQVRRAEDDAGDLWSTFNRIQENTVRGGLPGLTRTGRAATSRPLNDMQRDIEFNANLWRLTEELFDAY